MRNTAMGQQTRRSTGDQFQLLGEIHNRKDGFKIEATLWRSTHFIDAAIAGIGSGNNIKAFPRIELTGFTGEFRHRHHPVRKHT